jgi:hypothetical protein
MRTLFGISTLLVLLLTAGAAQAAFHLWDVTEVYSNADGSVQFVEFFTTTNSQDELFGHDVTSTATTFTIPHDLGTADPVGNPNGGGNNATANQHFLIATPGFAALPGAPTPDYVFDATNFFDTVADTITLVSADSLAFTSGELPIDGVMSLNEDFGGINRATAVNSPTNFAGDTGSIDASPPLPTPGLNATGFVIATAVLGLAALGVSIVRSRREV